MANTSGKGNAKDLQETAATAGHKAQEAASTVSHKAHEAGSAAAHRAQEAASTVGHRAQELASSAGQKVEDAKSSVASGMSSLASQLRQNAPHEGMLGSASGAVADRLQAGSRYLQDSNLQDMGEDFTSMVRRYPVASLLVGFGAGFLVGMMLTRR
jgi:ElaB/YqjD/DUF883 family membrane-anchored ribosome-binding protein